MQDRIVEFPNRYRFVKVDGTDDIYDLIPAAGEVTDEGTPINKTTMLTDETASALGLTSDDPTVNEALEKLAPSLQVKETLVQTKQAGTFVETSTGSTSSAKYINDIAANDNIIAYSSDQASNIGYSTDGGNTWNYYSNGNWVRAISECNGYIIATSISENASFFWLFTPSTGAWKQTNRLPDDALWGRAAYGNGKYVILNYSGTKAAYTDTVDGTWIATTLPVSSIWYDVAWGGNKFVAVGSAGIIYSTDGVTWTTATTSIVGSTAVCYGNGVFVTAAQGSSDYYYSYDGISWTKGAYPFAIWDVTFGDGQFVAVKTDTSMAYSADGVTWQATARTTGDTRAISFGGGKFWCVQITSGNSPSVYTTYSQYEMLYRLVTPDSTDETENVLSALGATKIETGSYTGTGTYGSSNPNSLTFDFAPKIVWIYGYSYLNAASQPQFFAMIDGGSTKSSTLIATELMTTSYLNNVAFTFENSGGGYGMKSSDGKTISWYNTSSNTAQLNNSSRTYYYLAIG